MKLRRLRTLIARVLWCGWLLTLSHRLSVQFRSASAARVRTGRDGHSRQQSGCWDTEPAQRRSCGLLGLGSRLPGYPLLEGWRTAVENDGGPDLRDMARSVCCAPRLDPAVPRGRSVACFRYRLPLVLGPDRRRGMGTEDGGTCTLVPLEGKLPCAQ